jgi:CYTH domain-containing protein
MARYPYEYQVNTSDIEGMMKMSLHPPIYKTSYEIPYRSILKNVVGRGYTDEGWVDDASIQISMYHGVLSPLVIADLYGLPDQKNALPMPSWLLNLQEITGQSEYSEFALSKAQRIPFLA